MKNLCLIFLLLSTFTFLNAQESKSFTLEEAIDYAQKNSETMKMALLNITDAEQRIVEMKSIGIPKVNGSAYYGHYLILPKSIIDFGTGPMEVPFGTKNTFNVGLDASTLLFDGQYLVGLKAAKVYKELTERQVHTVATDIRNSVTQVYLATLIIDENLLILDKNIATLGKSLLETKAFYENGFTELLDVERLELSLANVKVDKANLLRQREIAYESLKFMMGYTEEEEILASDDIEMLLEGDIPGLEGDVNYSNRSDYRVFEKRLEINDLNVKRIKQGYLPNLIGFVGLQESLQGNRLIGEESTWIPSIQLGLQLNVPIFDGFEKKAQVQRAKIDIERILLQQKLLERSIDTEVKIARQNYINSQEHIVSSKKNLELAEKIYNTTQIKYKEGVGSSIEVTQAEQELYKSQSNYIQALYDLLLAKTELLKALGEN